MLAVSALLCVAHAMCHVQRFNMLLRGHFGLAGCHSELDCINNAYVNRVTLYPAQNTLLVDILVATKRRCVGVSQCLY